MLFCEKCGSILMPKKDGKTSRLVCPRCGFKSKQNEKVEIKENIKPDNKPELEIIEDEKEAYPLVDKRCPKCGHDKAYFWEIQTRASDEPATQFFKCEKCKKVWRYYG